MGNYYYFIIVARCFVIIEPNDNIESMNATNIAGLLFFLFLKYGKISGCDYRRKNQCMRSIRCSMKLKRSRFLFQWVRTSKEESVHHSPWCSFFRRPIVVLINVWQTKCPVETSTQLLRLTLSNQLRIYCTILTADADPRLDSVGHNWEQSNDPIYRGQYLLHRWKIKSMNAINIEHRLDSFFRLWLLFVSLIGDIMIAKVPVAIVTAKKQL